MLVSETNELKDEYVTPLSGTVNSGVSETNELKGEFAERCFSVDIWINTDFIQNILSDDWKLKGDSKIRIRFKVFVIFKLALT